MLLIGPFAQAEAQYRQSRLVQHEIESYRRRRTVRRRTPWRLRWRPAVPTTASLS